jgi:hypothetical protein
LAAAAAKARAQAATALEAVLSRIRRSLMAPA